MPSLEAAEKIEPETAGKMTLEDVFVHPEREMETEDVPLEKLKAEEDRLKEIMLLIESQAEVVRKNLINISELRLNKG